ncbi:MAG TPA: cytochrome c oxidase assembly factor Coa1 family protein [Polyangiales bacterium]|nr:cytochrome c oxidase assembly factor Coa1 family protein [Polyangiales bacterium]
MENTSGQGKGAAVPQEIDRWNWGAFGLSWIWGLGNNTLLSLLVFVPCVGVLVMPIVLGLKGSAWAWQNKRWDSIEEFRRVQRGWAIGAFTLMGFAVIAAVGGGFAATAALKSSEAYQIASQRVTSDPQVQALLGTPIQSGMPQGSIEATPADGKAQIRFSVEGPRGEGMVYVDAVKDMGRWNFNKMELELEGRTERLVLADATQPEPKPN